MKKSGDRWEVLYHPAVRKDISDLNKGEIKNVRLAIEKKLSVNPILYGIPLRGSLRQLWKVRVGDFRIVFALDNKTVKILVIANRKNVYQLADRRNY